MSAKSTEENDFLELMAIMKGGESSKPIDTITDKIKQNKSLLRRTDRDGCTALHKGIYEGCQAEKLTALLAIDSAIAKDKHKGRLPLHLALEHNPKEEVLDRLLDAYHQALDIPDINDGRLPLHLILEHQPFPALFVGLGIKVLQRYPEAARKTSHDRLPLQICLENGLRPKLTLEVIKAFRSAACVPTREGKLPLHIAVEQNLDPRVVDLLIEANPAALIAKMVSSPGQDWVVLEYAIRNHRAPLMVKSLLRGGTPSGRNPKAIAYARAAAVGRITKDTQIDKSHMQARKEFDYSEDIQPGSRRKLHFSVQPFAGETLQMECEPTDKVEVLKKKIQDIEGTPADKMRLTREGEQLMDGYDLTHYGLVKNCKIEMRPRFEVLQQALRHGAEKDAILQLLEMRPEAAAEDDQHGALPLELGINNRAAEEVIIKLLEQYPLATKKPCSSGGELGEYPLHTALRQQYTAKVIQKILEDCTSDDWSKNGAYCPEAGGKEDSSSLLPLHMAIRSPVSPERKLHIINKLLAVKCPIEARDPVTGYSALDVVLSTPPVAFEVFIHVYQNLREARPTVAVEQGKNGQCPLHIAVVHNAGQVIIEKLCNVAKEVLDVYDIDGRLPIHLGVSCGASFAVVKSLLQHGPETLLKTDGHGKTPLQLAVSHKAQPGVVFEICRTNRKTLNVKDARGRSLLELALSHDAPPWVIQELLEASPAEMSNLNLLSGKWPNTKASAEALRFAFEARRKSAQGKGGSKGKRSASSMLSTSGSTSFTPGGGSPRNDGYPSRMGSSSGLGGQADSSQEESPQDQSVLTSVGRWFGF